LSVPNLGSAETMYKSKSYMTAIKVINQKRTKFLIYDDRIKKGSIGIGKSGLDKIIKALHPCRALFRFQV